MSQSTSGEVSQGDEIHPLALLLQVPLDPQFRFSEPMELQKAKAEDFEWTWNNITDPLQKDDLLSHHFGKLSIDKMLGRLVNTQEEFNEYINRYFHYLHGSPDEMIIIREQIRKVLELVKKAQELYTETILPNQRKPRSQEQAFEHMTWRSPRKSTYRFDFYNQMNQRNHKIDRLFAKMRTYFQVFSYAAEPSIHLSLYILHNSQSNVRLPSRPKPKEASKIAVYNWTYRAEMAWADCCRYISPPHSRELVKIDEEVYKPDRWTWDYRFDLSEYPLSKDFHDPKKREVLMKAIESKFLGFVGKGKVAEGG